MKFLIAIVFALFLTTIAQAQTPPPYSQNKVIYKTVTVLSGATVSNELNIGGYELVGFTLPATMTGTAVTFTVAAASGGTSNVTYNAASTAISWTTTAGGRYYAANSQDVKGWQFIKFVSGTAEGADRIITLHLKAI